MEKNGKLIVYRKYLKRIDSKEEEVYNNVEDNGKGKSKLVYMLFTQILCVG